MHRRLVWLIAVIITCSHSCWAADWPQWRGPDGNGHAVDAASANGELPPLSFGPDQNAKWKTALPGRGHGSPTVVGDRIFLATADEASVTQSVLALDRESGRVLWNTLVFQEQAWPDIHNKNTHASSTIACDGTHLFATFYSGGKIRLACLSVAGRLLWKKDLSDFVPKYPFGYAASPLLFEGTVIATMESQSENAIAAFRKENGAEVWRTQREKNSSYSSPALVFIAGRRQLCLSGNRKVIAYDPRSGQELWSAAAAAQHTAGTVVSNGEFLIASGGYPQSETTCIRANGSGEVVWKNNQKCYEQSMLIVGGHVFAVTDKGVAYCWDITHGKERWKKRLAGPISASPVLVGNRIYACNEKGQVFVFSSNPEKYEELARFKLGDELFPTPTFLDGQIFARVASRGQTRQEFLFCFEKQ